MNDRQDNHKAWGGRLGIKVRVLWELREGVSHPVPGVRKSFLEETKSNLEHRRGIRNLVGRMRNKESKTAFQTESRYVRYSMGEYTCPAQNCSLLHMAEPSHEEAGQLTGVL